MGPGDRSRSLRPLWRVRGGLPAREQCCARRPGGRGADAPDSLDGFSATRAWKCLGHTHPLHALRGSALREGLPGGRDLPESADGITAQIWERCIGCRYCMIACPYARRYFNWSEPHWPGDDPSSLNPDVAPRPRGVVEKCTLCHHRIRAAIERARVDEEPLTDEALRRLPACAQSCPTQAITFGDLADPDIRGCAPGGEPARRATSSRGRHAAQGHLPAGGEVKRAAIVVLSALVTIGAYAWAQQSRPRRGGH